MNANKTTSSIYDVIISGAGPVGLFLSCELSLRGCSVLVLEKTDGVVTPLKSLPFGVRGLSAPTIEALDRRGLLNELEVHKHLKNPHQNAKGGAQRQVGHFAGIPFREGNVDESSWPYRLASSTKPSLISTMEEIETILKRRANELGVIILYSSGVSAFHSSDTNVTVEAGGHLFQSSWLVGCDGSRSIVRKAAGFTFAGTEPEFTGYSAKVDIEDPQKLQQGRIITDKGMYLQSQPGFLQIQDFDGGAFHGSEKPVTREHVQEVLRSISNTNVTITALHIATTWTDRARQATEYRKGRVLLAGDAAHIHAPLGGQGLNLGIGDAMNLGWKLAAVIREKASAELLDTYFTERSALGAQVLEWSRAQVALMNPSPGARALNNVMRDLLNTRDGATYMAARVWGINLQYDLGAEHPLVGRTVPNFKFEAGSTVGELLRTGDGLLIDFQNDFKLKLITEEFNSLKYVGERTEDSCDARALLVRPDGYVAWATNEAIDEFSFRQALDRWFVRKP